MGHEPGNGAGFGGSLRKAYINPNNTPVADTEPKTSQLSVMVLE